MAVTQCLKNAHIWCFYNWHTKYNNLQTYFLVFRDDLEHFLKKKVFHHLGRFSKSNAVINSLNRGFVVDFNKIEDSERGECYLFPKSALHLINL